MKYNKLIIIFNLIISSECVRTIILTIFIFFIIMMFAFYYIKNIKIKYIWFYCYKETLINSYKYLYIYNLKHNLLYYTNICIYIEFIDELYYKLKYLFK